MLIIEQLKSQGKTSSYQTSIMESFEKCPKINDDSKACHKPTELILTKKSNKTKKNTQMTEIIHEEV